MPAHPDMLSLMGVDAAKIRKLRTALGLSMEAAAETASMKSRQQWYSVEAGERPNPSIETVQRIAKALGVTVNDLLK